MRQWVSKVRDWFRRAALDRELAEEMRFHLTQLERDAREAGADPAEAQFAARRKLGNATRAREESRDHWSVPLLDHLQQDVRYALRGLRRSPGFTATVVATLALGLGANVTMFNLVDQLMYRPLPYLKDPATVHRVYLQTTVDGRLRTNSTISFTRYLDLRANTTSFADFAAVTERKMAIGTGESARERSVDGVTASLFRLFDATPAVGRFFTEDEDRTPTGQMVAVLGHSYWVSELGRADVVGTTVQIGTQRYTIVGVAPEGFVGTSIEHEPDAFIPISTVPATDARWAQESYFTQYNWDWVNVFVRRKPAVDLVTANADLTNAYIRSRATQKLINPAVLPPERAHPRSVAGAVKSAAGPDAGLESRTLLWIMGVAAVVLIIAAANVANLMLARVFRRRREIGVRLALGVSRGRLARQFAVEGLVLALLGCVASIVVARWSGAIVHLALGPERAFVEIIPSWRALGLACVFAIATGLVTSIPPALLAARGDLLETLRAGMRDANYRRSRVRSWLLIAQGALSVVLLVGAGLFVRSLGNVRSMNLGYDPEPVLIATPNFRGLEFDSASATAMRRRLIEAAKSVPGVVAATTVSNQPFGTSTTDLFVPGIDSVPKLGRFNFLRTTSDYFATVGTRIVRGRAFTAQDREGMPRVVIVSDAMARALWPDRDAIGQCLHIGVHSEAQPCYTVVGVAENAVHQSLTEDKQFMYYVPADQLYPAGIGDLFVRVASTDPDASVELVRRAIQRALPPQGYVSMGRLESVIDRQRRSWILGATMFVAFGVLALVVAAVGLYGVIAYDVAQRLHELGVRVALGAQTRDIVRLVVGQGLSFGAIGAAIGVSAALVAARWIQPLLFQESARDPATYAGVCALIIAVAVVASAVPAIRASRADPNVALRSD